MERDNRLLIYRPLRSDGIQLDFYFEHLGDQWPRLTNIRSTVLSDVPPPFAEHMAALVAAGFQFTESETRWRYNCKAADALRQSLLLAGSLYVQMHLAAALIMLAVIDWYANESWRLDTDMTGLGLCRSVYSMKYDQGESLQEN